MSQRQWQVKLMPSCGHHCKGHVTVSLKPGVDEATDVKWAVSKRAMCSVNFLEAASNFIVFPYRLKIFHQLAQSTHWTHTFLNAQICLRAKLPLRKTTHIPIRRQVLVTVIAPLAKCLYRVSLKLSSSADHRRLHRPQHCISGLLSTRPEASSRNNGRRQVSI